MRSPHSLELLGAVAQLCQHLRQPVLVDPVEEDPGVHGVLAVALILLIWVVGA